MRRPSRTIVGTPTRTNPSDQAASRSPAKIRMVPGTAGITTPHEARHDQQGRENQHHRHYSLRVRKKARTYPSPSVTSKPHKPSSMNDNSFTNDAPRCLNSSNSASGSRV